jgi:endonuclease YncB( thermonuclease family)
VEGLVRRAHALHQPTILTAESGKLVVLRIPVIALVIVISPAIAETIAGRASVIDADTIEIHNQRIRILDIDAPESRQTCADQDGKAWRCGQQAALALSDWIGQQPLTCETTKRDRYKRWLAKCTALREDQ